MKESELKTHFVTVDRIPAISGDLSLESASGYDVIVSNSGVLRASSSKVWVNGSDGLSVGKDSVPSGYEDVQFSVVGASVLTDRVTLLSDMYVVGSSSHVLVGNESSSEYFRLDSGSLVGLSGESIVELTSSSLRVRKLDGSEESVLSSDGLSVNLLRDISRVSSLLGSDLLVESSSGHDIILNVSGVGEEVRVVGGSGDIFSACEHWSW